MAINPITPITPGLKNPIFSTSNNQTTGSSFSNLLSEAIGNAVETDVANQDSNLAILSDTDVELHTSMIESQKAELALSLAIQIRNKVVDAYNEVMRMQV